MGPRTEEADVSLEPMPPIDDILNLTGLEDEMRNYYFRCGTVVIKLSSKQKSCVRIDTHTQAVFRPMLWRMQQRENRSSPLPGGSHSAK